MSDFEKIKEYQLAIVKDIQKDLNDYVKELSQASETTKNKDSLLIEGSFWTNSYFICANAFQKFCDQWKNHKDEGKTAETLNTELILKQAVILHDKGMKKFIVDMIDEHKKGTKNGSNSKNEYAGAI